jgi:hypothetical protein
MLFHENCRSKRMHLAQIERGCGRIPEVVRITASGQLVAAGVAGQAFLDWAWDSGLRYLRAPQIE